MEDLTDVVTTEPRRRKYMSPGSAYSFDVPFSLIAEQFRVGDKFRYKGKTYEVKHITDNQQTFNFACLRVG